MRRTVPPELSPDRTAECSAALEEPLLVRRVWAPGRAGAQGARPHPADGRLRAPLPHRPDTRMSTPQTSVSWRSFP